MRSFCSKLVMRFSSRTLTAYLQNQMVESLLLFESLMSLTWFNCAAITLLLTKLDLFEEKVKRKPIESYFPDYTGPSCDSIAGREYFVNKFLSKDRLPGRKIETLCVDLTHTEGFRPVLDMIMNKSTEGTFPAY